MYCNAVEGSLVKVLVDDTTKLNRFNKGDTGILLKHDDPEHAEYEHCVELIKKSELGNLVKLKFYFMKPEVEFLKDSLEGVK